jgi:putative DNA primase/helicase
MKVNGISFRDLSDRIAKLMGVINTPEERKIDLAEERQRIAMQSVWDNAGQPSEGSPVGRYLKSRIGLPWSSKAIRQANDNPVMVSKVTGADGKPVNVHLTYLTPDGRKAAVVPCRRVMAGKLPDGCAIRLSPPAPIMGVAEGIETAISAAIMFDMPVWACINAGLLAKWTPPDIAEEIHIFGDNDLNYCGQAAAYRLANRLTVQCKRTAHVVIPIFPGTDWNDRLNGV